MYEYATHQLICDPCNRLQIQSGSEQVVQSAWLQSGYRTLRRCVSRWSHEWSDDSFAGSAGYSTYHMLSGNVDEVYLGEADAIGFAMLKWMFHEVLNASHYSHCDTPLC